MPKSTPSVAHTRGNIDDIFFEEMGREIAQAASCYDAAVTPLQHSRNEVFFAALDALCEADDEPHFVEPVSNNTATSQQAKTLSLSLNLEGVTHNQLSSCPVVLHSTSNRGSEAAMMQCSTPIKTRENASQTTISSQHCKPNDTLSKGANIKPPLKRRKLNALAISRPTRNLPSLSWRQATPVQKFARAVSASSNRDAYAFSLNLSSERQTSLVRSVYPIRLLSGYINRELRRAGLRSTPYAFALELSPDGTKLHLHGVVVPGGEPVEDLKRALQAAGGKISGRAGSRQLKLVQISNADGWAAYCQKDTWLTKKVLDGDRLTFISLELKRIVRDFALQHP